MTRTNDVHSHNTMGGFFQTTTSTLTLFYNTFFFEFVFLSASIPSIVCTVVPINFSSIKNCHKSLSIIFFSVWRVCACRIERKKDSSIVLLDPHVLISNEFSLLDFEAGGTINVSTLVSFLKYF
jgi:hypothetical protein